ncbi:MAG: amidohydrolase family protein [Flavobacteriales bacterium]|nr:amidohydrolase family protein [Flavobacteriales bacterium]
MLRPTLLLLLASLALLSRAQTTAPAAHVQDAAPALIAFTNCTLHTDARTAIARATLVVKDGKVLAAGAGAPIPAGAVVRDLKGLHIWPALIDPYSDLGLPALKREDRDKEDRAARHWNRALNADVRAHDHLRIDPKQAAEWRKAGFGTVFTHRMDGIARGTSCAVLLSDEAVPRSVIQADLAAHLSLRKGSSPDSYPSSQMGTIALIRQTILDARWYAAQAQPRETDAVLAALADQLKGRLVLEAADRNESLRWARILDEFQLPGIIKGTGDEYARLAAIKATGMPLIVPFAQPEAFDVEDPYDAQEVSFARLKHWELAAFNAMMLDTAGVSFALTAHGRKDLKDLWKDLRKLVACGLDSARAIELLTTDPARLFGVDDRIGALRPGMHANFLITSKHLLDARNTLHETWVSGKRFVVSDPDVPDLKGIYELNLAAEIWLLEMSGAGDKLEARVRRPDEADSLAVKARFERQGPVIGLSWAPRDKPQDLIRLNGTIHATGGLWDGQGQKPGGQWFAWSAIRKANSEKEKKAASGELAGGRPAGDSAAVKKPDPPGAITYPLMGYGWTEMPKQETVVFRDVTVWTNGPQGILRNTDVWVHQGRIVAVGHGLELGQLFPGRTKPAVTEIHATGKHLTAGIVDEHSHIAISRGVNEGTQAVTSEVRIGDVVNPDDINIYRNLAGGVTTIQQLHGSANPIGGQSAITKLRWGQAADSMQVRGAPGHIKFALGENVKQSNWNAPVARFPQTRMGVEQVYYEAFHRARDYDSEQRAWNAMRPRDRERATAPRRDLELDALLEILQGQRHISCHSYVQSEIDMLMHVADSMGFKVNTFTHILEGYKVAAKMKRHGVSGSTFSDWWAYKFEVNDAIPYNAALMHMHGVNTGINSDDAEMSRRLNQEAAKAVKYGGVPEEEAWKMVTLNPARMLKLDHRIGSVEPGKDADLVLWSEHPLSIRAKAEQTWVDGVRYYDAERDAEQRRWIAAERDRLVRAMIAAKGEGAPVRRAGREHQHLWCCEDIGEEGHEHDMDDDR